MQTRWEKLLTGATVFDGSGRTPRVEDIAIADGKIVARGVNLDASNAAEVLDLRDKWLMPGLLDIHTHMDLEVELDAGLSEVVRHGTTTVVVGNCSIGIRDRLAFGNHERR